MTDEECEFSRGDWQIFNFPNPGWKKRNSDLGSEAENMSTYFHVKILMVLVLAIAWLWFKNDWRVNSCLQWFILFTGEP